MDIIGRLLTLGVVLFVGSPTPASPKNGVTVRELFPDRLVISSLIGDPEFPEDDVYRVTLTDDMVQAVFELTETSWDMDLYLSREEYLEDYSEAEFAMVSIHHSERLVLNRFWGDGYLETGTWYLHVVGNPPRDIRDRTEPRYSLIFRPVLQQPVFIRPGIHTGRVEWYSGMTALYAFEVPVGTEAFRVAVQGNAMDMDLFLRREYPMLSRNDAQIFGKSYLARESVVVREVDIGEPLNGRWFLVVTQPPSFDHPDTFRLALTLGTTVPTTFKTIPTNLHLLGRSPLERSAVAVVEILHEVGGGSGVLVSSDGLILTNYHVVAGLDFQPLEQVAIAMSLDFGKPAVELFWADIVWSDADKDLAVVKIRRGLYDQDLPRGLRFPFLTPVPVAVPAVGDPIWVIGFSNLGGSGSKTSVTVSRGIVAGFEERVFGRVIKSDAEINLGNSGGAALDASLRFFALPTSTMSDQGGQLGFLHPVSFVPPEWLARMGR